MKDADTPNAKYLILRPYITGKQYFPAKAFTAKRDAYHRLCACPAHENGLLAGHAAYQAITERIMGGTARTRYYDNFSFARKLRRIGQGLHCGLYQIDEEEPEEAYA